MQQVSVGIGYKIPIPISELLKKYQCRYYTDTNTQKNTDTQPLILQYFRRWFPAAPSSFLLALTYAWTKSRISLLSIEKRHLKHSLTMIARDTCASSGMLFFVPLCSAVFRCSRFSKLEFVRLIFFWALIRLFLPSLLLSSYLKNLKYLQWLTQLKYLEEYGVKLAKNPKNRCAYSTWGINPHT